MRWIIALMIVLLVFVVGCVVECPECDTCPEPEACPTTECPKLDCSDCPVVKEEVPVETIKYQCADGSVEDSLEDCTEEEEPPELVPITTNQEGTYVENASYRPACRESVNAAELYFEVGRIPDTYEIQVRQAATDYSTVLTKPGLFQKYLYARVCNGCGTHGDDITLELNKLYLLRFAFDYDGDMQYSNELLIDTRSRSDIMGKDCS